MATREPPATARPCPICGRPAVDEHLPFCSPRCQKVDLHRWFTGAYAIPVVEEDGGTGEAE